MVELNLEQPETNPEQRLERDFNGLCLSCAVKLLSFVDNTFQSNECFKFLAKSQIGLAPSHDQRSYKVCSRVGIHSP